MDEKTITAAQNEASRQMVTDEWSLGPDRASVQPTANGPFWRAMADRWKVDEVTARRRLCANCEYYDNTPDALEMMEAVPLDRFDMDGGGRGFCVKFDFICHNLRTCQAWEEKPALDEEDGDWKY